MNRPIGRIVAVFAGAATLFGLQQGFGVVFYIALPAAIAVYVAVRFAFGLLSGTDGKAI